METYIVRVYVREADVPELIAGTAEQVESGCEQSFVGLPALLSILSSGRGCSAPRPNPLQSVPNP
jgi:hypothetical protein